MSRTDRRQFLRMAATSAGAATAFAALPPAIRNALARPLASRTGSIDDVEHVVIFMQENRSFDHYYASLRGVRGFGDRTAIPLAGGDDVWHQPYAGHADGYLLPYHMDTLTTSATCGDAAAMSYPVDIAMWNQGRYDAWNTARAPSMGMGHFRRDDLPFYYALADAFTICDHYHCSTLTQTNPNRLHLFTGSNGLSVGQAPVLDNSEPSEGFTWPTYAERLETAGISWRVYQESNNFDDNALAWFRSFKQATPGQALYDKGIATVPDLVAAFAADVANDNLPQVSWIVAADYLSEHADYKPAYGEDLSARLIAALAANPEVWAKTVFLLNYDENGGFFDHVPPPTPPATAGDGLSTVDTTGEISEGLPIGLGFRVPMIIVSPWTQGGWLCSQVFDHTSVIRFLEQRFGVAEPNISAWRRAVSGDLTSAFDFSQSTTAWPPLPDTSGYDDAADQQCNTLPDPTIPLVQSMPSQEPGTRPARALPYELHANGRIDAASGRFWIDFGSTGASAAVLQVRSGNRADGPWRYTVGSGDSLSDYWNVVAYTSGVYDFSVHAPNGFLRQFRGDIAQVTRPGAADLEVSALYDSAAGAISLRIVNSGGADCVVIVEDGAYGLGAARSYTVAAGAEVDDRWVLTASANWYDLRVTAPALDGFLRRFAGHLENGLPSSSDPAIAAPRDRVFGDGFDGRPLRPTAMPAGGA